MVLLGKDDLHPARPPAGSLKPTFHVVPEVPSDTHRAWFDRGTVSTGYGGPGRVTAGRTASGSPRSLSLSPDPPNYAESLPIVRSEAIGIWNSKWRGMVGGKKPLRIRWVG